MHSKELSLKIETKKKKVAVTTSIKELNQKRIEYTVRIGNHLYQRITRHLLLLKHLKSSESKQKWIQEAIQEKLAADEQTEVQDRDRYLHLSLNEKIWKDLEKRIDHLRTIRISVSKKVFIEEAIFEKLDKEESKSKELIKKMLNL